MGSSVTSVYFACGTSFWTIFVPFLIGPAKQVADSSKLWQSVDNLSTFAATNGSVVRQSWIDPCSYLLFMWMMSYENVFTRNDGHGYAIRFFGSGCTQRCCAMTVTKCLFANLKKLWLFNEKQAHLQSPSTTITIWRNLSNVEAVYTFRNSTEVFNNFSTICSVNISGLQARRTASVFYARCPRQTSKRRQDIEFQTYCLPWPFSLNRRLFWRSVESWKTSFSAVSAKSSWQNCFADLKWRCTASTTMFSFSFKRAWQL